MDSKLKVQTIEIEKIKPYENNPRKNEKAIKAVANSIKQFGFRNPIILDKDLVIISGHTRRLAALQLGLKTVPCIIRDDLTETQVKAFRLADNRVAEVATWDDDLLKAEMSKVIDMDLADFGFDFTEIDTIIQEKTGVNIHRCPKCGAEWTDKEE